MGKLTKEELGRDVPFTWLSNAVLDDKRLGRLGLLVYLAIARFAGYASRTAWPGIDRIAAVAGLSRRSAIQGIQELEKLKYIKIQRKPTPTGFHNFYELQDRIKGRTKPLEKTVKRGGSATLAPPRGGGSATTALGVVQPLHPNDTYKNKKNSLTKGLGNNNGLAAVSPASPENREQRIEQRRAVLSAQARQLGVDVG